LLTFSGTVVAFLGTILFAIAATGFYGLDAFPVSHPTNTVKALVHNQRQSHRPEIYSSSELRS